MGPVLVAFSLDIKAALQHIECKACKAALSDHPAALSAFEAWYDTSVKRTVQMHEHTFNDLDQATGREPVCSLSVFCFAMGTKATKR